jgi:hypothetical protein
MFCCKTGHSVKKWILSHIYPKEPIVYQSNYGDISILALVSLDERIRKYKVWKKDEDIDVLSSSKIYDILQAKVDAPWLWIGCTTIFGEVDMTSSLDQYLVGGNHVTLELLSRMYPYHWNWRYLDPVTFKEVEFPEDGITIDDSRVERSEKEKQESKANQ